VGGQLVVPYLLFHFVVVATFFKHVQTHDRQYGAADDNLVQVGGDVHVEHRAPAVPTHVQVLCDVVDGGRQWVPGTDLFGGFTQVESPEAASHEGVHAVFTV
tara:strand:+ start:785 stop:1090 length:306 start_codon:yes stop_codon:yes gene_type:complete